MHAAFELSDATHALVGGVHPQLPKTQLPQVDLAIKFLILKLLHSDASARRGFILGIGAVHFGESTIDEDTIPESPVNTSSAATSARKPATQHEKTPASRRGFGLSIVGMRCAHSGYMIAYSAAFSPLRMAVALAATVGSAR